MHAGEPPDDAATESEREMKDEVYSQPNHERPAREPRFRP